MIIQCHACKKKYDIPDEKLPAGKEFSLPCPSCKTPISVIKKKNASDSQSTTPEKSKSDFETGEALLKKIIKNSKAMPPMPQIMTKATEVMSDETKGFKEIGEVLEADQAMATRVLKIANSAYYSLSVPVSSVQQASALLGCQTLLELITVVSTSKMMGKSLSGYGIDSESVWKHSLLVGTASKMISEKKFPALKNDAFNAGLIHDSGMIILDEYVVKRKELFNGIDMGNESELVKAEKNAFGFDHCEVASEFFKKWKLPKTQTKAIRYHHAPSESSDDELSYILHIADILSKYGASVDLVKENAEKGSLDVIGLSDTEIESIYLESTEAVSGIISSIKGG